MYKINKNHTLPWNGETQLGKSEFWANNSCSGNKKRWELDSSGKCERKCGWEKMNANGV